MSADKAAERRKSFYGLRSVRVRIGLLSAVCTAAILALFGATAYQQVKRTAWDAIDHDLRAHAALAFGSDQRPLAWPRIEEQIENAYPADGPPQIVFFAHRTDAPHFFRSRGWPLELDPRALLPEVEISDEWQEVRSLPPRGEGQRPGETVGGDPQDTGPREVENAGFRRGPPGQGRRRGGAPEVDRDPEKLEAALKPDRKDTMTTAGRTWRFATFIDGGDSLVVGRRLDSAYADLGRFRNALLVVSPFALIFAFCAAVFVSGRALRPVREITAAVEKVTADSLSRRVTSSDSDIEFARLIAVVNEMLDRLEGSFEDARRFSGLAAHELKTPLTILQGKIDLAIHKERAGTPRQQFLAELLSEVARLKGVTERLLLLSRADAGRLDLDIGPVHLSELLEQHLQDTELLAPELRVESEIAPGEIIQGDRMLINLLLQNLFSNAIKHNRGGAGGFVHVELTALEDGLRLAVSNSAEPIPSDRHEAIFARFQRGHGSSGAAVDGAGLGLSLAREIARAHGGRLKLKESGPLRTTFVLKLRRIAEPPANVSTNWQLLGRRNEAILSGSGS